MSEACKTPSRRAPGFPDALDDFQPYPAYGKSAEEVRRLENRILGRMIRELRQAAALPLARIAEETGHAPDDIHAIEEGHHPLPLRTFIILTEMADIPLDQAATQALTHLDRLHYPPESGEEEPE